MKTTEIAQKTSNGFSDYYSHFREFQLNPKYRGYWEKCIESVTDNDLLNNIIFCNDVFAIPPVKTFLTYYRNDFIRLTDDEKAVLDTFIKRSIGAFWGMVFK